LSIILTKGGILKKGGALCAYIGMSVGIFLNRNNQQRGCDMNDFDKKVLQAKSGGKKQLRRLMYQHRQTLRLAKQKKEQALRDALVTKEKEVAQ